MRLKPLIAAPILVGLSGCWVEMKDTPACEPEMARLAGMAFSQCIMLQGVGGLDIARNCGARAYATFCQKPKR